MPASEPFITFHVPADGRDDVVDAILRAHIRHTAARDLRISWVHVLAVLGGFMALAMIAPAALPEWLRANVAVAWGLCCLGTVGTAIRERMWRQRRERLLAANARLSAADPGRGGYPPPSADAGGAGPHA